LQVNDRFVSSAVYVLLAALGGAAITAAATLWGVRMGARRSARTQQAERRLQAYADLLVAAGEVLGTYRRDLYSWSSDFGQQDADRANAHMADLADTLHRASAVVSLTGSELGRRQGKALYETARGVAGSRIVATEDDSRPYVRTRADDKALEVAIDDYKAALVPETTALP
jgi:hypothetical protein